MAIPDKDLFRLLQQSLLLRLEFANWCHETSLVTRSRIERSRQLLRETAALATVARAP